MFSTVLERRAGLERLVYRVLRLRDQGVAEELYLSLLEGESSFAELATRFSKGLMPWTGYRSEEIAYSRVARVGGATSWSSFKLWRYALDGIFSFTVKPLKVWGVIGVLISLVSFVYAALIVLRTLLFGVDLPGYASLIVAVLFLGGIQLIGIGVLGEYIGRIYIDVKRRPHYFIRAVHECAAPPIPIASRES